MSDTIRRMEVFQLMRKRLLLLSLLFVPIVIFFCRPMSGQLEQHAPTSEQCRADAAAWNVPEHFVFDRDAFSSMVARSSQESARILDERRAELQLCEKTDRLHATRYSLGGTAYGVAEVIRMGDFMHRHNLMQQFYKEDDEGQR